MIHRKTVVLAAALVVASFVAGCGVVVADLGGGAPADEGSAVEIQQDRTTQAADLMLSLAKGVGGAEPGAGWSGGWDECVTYVGHQVELRLSGEFGAQAFGREPKDEIVAAIRAAGWQVSMVRNDPGFVSFGFSHDGVSGGMVIENGGIEIDAGTDCVDVSGDDATRLVAAPSLHSDR